MRDRLQWGMLAYMPDQPTWLERVPEILQQLNAPGAPPFLDRPAIERLFGVRRRQAIELMGRLAGYQVGRTFLVERGAVVGFLGRPSLRGAADQAVARKRRVLEHLEEARRDWAARNIRIPVAAGGEERELPEGVELRPGQLIVRFEQPLELLAKLFALSRVLARDFEGMVEAGR